MNKRPLSLRTLITVVVLLVFTLAIHPLFQRDYYETFLGMLKDKQDSEAHQVVKEAKALQDANPQLYQSQALLQAADSKGLDLTKKVNGNDLQDNRDVMSLIRKNASSSIRLGLDLNGGVEFILQLVPDQEFLAMFKEDDTNAASREEMQARMASEFDRYRDIAIEILRKRLEGQKIFEAEIAPSGSSYVALRAPVVAKDEKLKLLNLIKMSARLNFRLVHENNAELVKQYLADKTNFVVPVGYELLTTSEFRPGQEPKVEYYFVNKIPEMTGKGISNAMATKDEFGQRKIQLRFSQAGAEDFARVTSRNIGRQLAIVLDGNLYCAPVVNQAITGGSAEISGRFSDEEAKSIADALVSGSFPFQIKVDAVFDTDPKLGASNVANGIWVGAISLVLVAIFMCGIILTIGMAVDANVLVFERIREELKSGKSLMNAVDYGYQKAFSAVFDANLTTLITSIILMSVGTGAIKGFAVTLSIGILTSLFTALFVTRLIFDYLFRYTHLSALPMLQFFKKTEFNFNRMWSKAMTISGILILLSIVVFFVRGRSMLGVDFTGGTQVTFTYAEQIPQEKLEAALKKAGYDATVTYKYNAAAATDNSKVEILVRGDLTKANANESPMDHLATLLNKEFPTAKLSNGLESSIGGLIGWEFTKAALLAIAFSIVGIGAYVTLRYEFTYALTSILALLHDVIIVTGIFLALGRTISLTVIAALLTVIGYSINDTVVIFDRIRENASLKTCKTYEENVNLSINQTLNRTMLTSLTTFIVVFVLFLGAGVAINDFVLIMMLGIIVGTYSSVFLAGPMVALMRRMRSKRESMANAPAVEKR